VIWVGIELESCFIRGVVNFQYLIKVDITRYILSSGMLHIIAWWLVRDV